MVSNLIKTPLKLPGVSKLGQFGGNSTRYASTSKANLGGLSAFLFIVSWSNESNWQNFCLKEIFPSENIIFQANFFFK